MATLATAVIQDLTYTEKTLGLDVSITYTNDGVAGSEVVSVSGHNISVKIESGVSTATQIRTKVLAHNEAKDLVTIVISGTGSNAQVSCVRASLANGSVALKASKQIGGILYTAKVAGVAGNSITIQYVHHATTLSAVATGNDIVVTFKSGVTKMSAIMALIRADTNCNALVAVTQVVPDSEQYVSYASSALNLATGADAIESSVIVQDLTFASITQDSSKNGKTITYLPGGTAGSEVVTVLTGNVTVEIEDGVSDADDIKTAVDLVTAFTNDYTCTVSGTGSNAQTTVNAVALSGGVGNGEAAIFVNDAALTLTSNYQLVNFNFTARQLFIVNDESSGAKAVIYSYDGITDHEQLDPGESITLDNANANGIFLKYGTGAPAYKLMAAAL
jgi:hypothetical protein